MSHKFEVTPSAAEKIKAISASENKAGYGLRVRVAGGGCSGPQYQLGLEEKEGEGDFVVDSQGVKIFIDPQSSEVVQGSTLDFIEGPNGSGFKISNPNAQSQGGGCGSGSSGGGGGCGSGGCGSGGGHDHGHDHGEKESGGGGGGCGSGGCGCG